VRCALPALPMQLAFTDDDSMPGTVRFEHGQTTSGPFKLLGDVPMLVSTPAKTKIAFNIGGSGTAVQQYLRVTLIGHTSDEPSGRQSALRHDALCHMYYLLRSMWVFTIYLCVCAHRTDLHTHARMHT
jgi:hypothetical protein